MKPTVTLATASSPGDAALALLEHDGQYFLQLDGVPLQNSFSHGAATELARLACAPFRAVRQPRVVLGGLGLGFTLAASRDVLPQTRATFLVAEPCPELPGWHRLFLEGLHPGQLDDSRVLIEPHSLSEVLAAERATVHAVLLDAGGSPPTSGVTDSNGLPTSSFLHLAHSSLKEGGLLAVACATGSPPLERRLRRAGFDVAHESVPASHKGKQKRRSSLWLARKGSHQR